MTSYRSEGPKLAITDGCTREEQARRNREKFPELAEVMALFPGAKLRWARNPAGDEIGRKPELEPHLFEISAETWTEMQKPAPAGKAWK